MVESSTATTTKGELVAFHKDGTPQLYLESRQLWPIATASVSTSGQQRSGQSSPRLPKLPLQASPCLHYRLGHWRKAVPLLVSALLHDVSPDGCSATDRVAGSGYWTYSARHRRWGYRSATNVPVLEHQWPAKRGRARVLLVDTNSPAVFDFDENRWVNDDDDSDDDDDDDNDDDSDDSDG